MLRRLAPLMLFAGVCFALFICGGARLAIAQTPADAAQPFEKRITVGAETEILIRNSRGRVQVTTASAEDTERDVVINATGQAGASVGEGNVVVERARGRVTIAVAENKAESATNNFVKRVDLAVKVPARARVRIEATEGAVEAVGDFRSLDAETTTGTIRADVPNVNLRYQFLWTASRPRIYSALDLTEPRERAGGRYEISGRYPAKKKGGEEGSGSAEDQNDSAEVADAEVAEDAEAKSDDERQRERKRLARERQVELRLTTARGVVLLGVETATVPVDLRERTLTEAARAFIRGGNETLIDRVRRVAPRLVDEYAGTLPARRGAPPRLAARGTAGAYTATRVTATVTDRAGRPLTDLTKNDFALTLDGVAQEILEVTPSEAPFNLVLLLDVSGSVEERLDFIRRAALRFVSTASPQDRIAIITFRDDIATISDFTADRAELTTRINTIRAGGATALYDALAYVLTETLRRLPEREADRTAVVTLSDGDDNRSFLSFRNVLDLTRETGTPIYPLYVPSGLIPADTMQIASRSGNNSATTRAGAPDDLDPTRTRMLTLTTVAGQEGATLARETGGVFYPLARLEDLQQAYDDIVRQLRTSYTITFRPLRTAQATATNGADRTDDDAQARGVRVRVRRPNAVVVRMGQATDVK